MPYIIRARGRPGSLGLEAQLPPPEEVKDVKSASEVARAEKDRKIRLVKKSRAR